MNYKADTLESSLQNTANSSHPYIDYLWQNITLEFMLKFFVVYFFAIWIALIIWVARDISLRTESKIVQILGIMIIIFLTPLGIFLYLLARPRKTLSQESSLEVESNLDILNEIIDERLQKSQILHCPNCDIQIEAEFTQCPNCHTELKHDCSHCEREIRNTWDVCPYCQKKQVKKAAIFQKLGTEIPQKVEIEKLSTTQNKSDEGVTEKIVSNNSIPPVSQKKGKKYKKNKK
ncbi:hypothetical protein GW846_04145 [Candidatus Gracilibacteria bacterium]|nr:hypothetical protein [Candidatus Gracilibacteria bacterium]